MNDETEPVLKVAAERAGGEVVTLSTGVRARLHAVSASLVDAVTAQIKDPPVPIWHNPEKDRDEPNSSDPAYIRALAENRAKRGRAAIDAMVMFGVELADGVPDEETWLPRLRLLESLGHLDLSTYDLDDALTREFLFKRLVAVGAGDLVSLTRLSGIREEDVAVAKESFPGSEARTTH